MIAQCSQPVPQKHSPHLRRIPRGTSTVSDSLICLKRQAEANRKRIRGMKRRVTNDDDRKALSAAHTVLVEVILCIGLRPEAVKSGTYDVIHGTMAEARAIYTNAEKSTKPRSRKRKNNDRDDDQPIAPERYTGEEDDKPLNFVLTPSNRCRDAVADAFQATLEYDPTILN